MNPDPSEILDRQYQGKRRWSANSFSKFEIRISKFRLTWPQRHRLRTFFRSSLWIVPLGCMLLALVIAPILRELDARTNWTLLGFTPNGARSLVGALVASGLSFIVFTFSILLVAVQIASGNLSPRVIPSFLKDRPVKIVLGVFVFTFTYSVAVLGRIENSVLQLPMVLVILFNLVSIGGFLYLIDYTATSLRPVSMAARIATEGLGVIESVYPRALSASGGAPAERETDQLGAPSRTVTYGGTSGVIVAMHVEGLVALAQRVDCVLKMVPQVGEFVGRGEPFFHVFGGRDTLDERELHEAVAFGAERTMHQDPEFVFRILVDIAAKALSPSINDPTTAVLVTHQIHRLLRLVGTRDLSTGRILDRAGHLRLVYRTPNWEDFVSLAVTEIRLYGAGSMQVPRRLRAMLENLIQVLPAVRAPALREQLSLLDRSVHRGFPDREDQVRAETADYQGVGGAR